MPAPEMALAKASAHAHRIRLGTSVISVPFHHPFHVAERMAFLDHLTRGRAILGVGPCALVTDKNLFGLADRKALPDDGRVGGHHRALARIARSHRLSTDNTGSSSKCVCNSVPISSRACRSRSRRREIRSVSSSPASTGCCFCRRPGKMQAEQSDPRPNSGIPWRRSRRSTAAQTSRDNWRHRHLRLSRRDTGKRRGAMSKRTSTAIWSISFSIGLKAPYEVLPRPAAHMRSLLRSGADRRDWIIGTPDDAIAQIERMQARNRRLRRSVVDHPRVGSHRQVAPLL